MGLEFRGRSKSFSVARGTQCSVRRNPKDSLVEGAVIGNASL